ncbi:MAG: dgpfaetke family protein [Planctomycetaceae bacterium]|nr:dgpfaetke family protein [Planctomycetaceae bacterium]
MKVMVIVKASKESEAGQMPSEELLTAMGKFNQQLVNAGIMLAGEGLQPSSKGARVRFSGTNRTVIDGPFAETKELIAGYWIWQVRSMAEAIEWVKRCPNPHPSECEIEIRPHFEAADFGEAFTPELREQEAALRAQTLGLGTPSFENGREMLIAGLNASYTLETRMKIPAQWERFAPSIGKIPGQVGSDAYGVCWNNKPDCAFDYLTGAEVSAANELPAGFTQVHLPAHRYIVFKHTKHISEIAKTLEKIWIEWFPSSGLNSFAAPCFERYTKDFNPMTGLGGVEIWIPI